MSPTISKALSALTLLSSALALPTTPKLTPRTTYPFTKIVAYGDELSDNGNGSYAHGITGNPKTVYGFGTWKFGVLAGSVRVQSLKSLKFVTPVKLILMYAFA